MAYPTALTFNDFAERAKYGDFSSIDVIVEHPYQETVTSKPLTALFPARAYIDRRHPNELILDYCHFVSLNPIHRFFSYNEQNMPTMYDKNLLDVGPRLAVAVGFLLLWNKETDRMVKSENLHYWWEGWRNEKWYTWSNRDQDYTEVWEKGHTKAEYDEWYKQHKKT